MAQRSLLVKADSLAQRPLSLDYFAVVIQPFLELVSPAVAASGMIVANTLAPVSEHLKLLDQCLV